MLDIGLEELKKDLQLTGVDMGIIDEYYTFMVKSLVPKSVEGISSRMYSYWKTVDLVDFEDHQIEGSTGIRLNLFQFIWVKVLKYMTDLGIPLATIKEAKEFIFFDIVNILNEKEELLKLLKTDSNYSITEINATEHIIEYLKGFEDSTHDYKIYKTIIGAIITGIIIRDDQASFVISKDMGNFELDFFTYKTLPYFKDYPFTFLNKPHFQIPIRPLIEEFMDEPKNGKIAETFGLINQKEKKVLDALRKNDFKEIIIRFENNNKDQMILEELVEGDIRDQKAKEIKRILGMSQYSEITLKYRNDTHIYFKNKTRL